MLASEQQHYRHLQPLRLHCVAEATIKAQNTAVEVRGVLVVYDDNNMQHKLAVSRSRRALEPLLSAIRTQRTAPLPDRTAGAPAPPLCKAPAVLLRELLFAPHLFQAGDARHKPREKGGLRLALLNRIGRYDAST